MQLVILIDYLLQLYHMKVLYPTSKEVKERDLHYSEELALHPMLLLQNKSSAMDPHLEAMLSMFLLSPKGCEYLLYPYRLDASKREHLSNCPMSVSCNSNDHCDSHQHGNYYQIAMCLYGVNLEVLHH